MNPYLIIAILAIVLLLQSTVIALVVFIVRKREKSSYYIRKSGKKLVLEVKPEKKYKQTPEKETEDAPALLDEKQLPLLRTPSEEYYIAEKIISYCAENDTILDKEFRLDDLALNIGTNRNYISKALNKILQINFNQLKNYYRIYKTCNFFISNPDTNLGALFEISKFSSFTTFCIAFNKHTHLPPNRWCKDVTKRIADGENVNIQDYLQPLKAKTI